MHPWNYSNNWSPCPCVQKLNQWLIALALCKLGTVSIIICTRTQLLTNKKRVLLTRLSRQHVCSVNMQPFFGTRVTKILWRYKTLLCSNKISHCGNIYINKNPQNSLSKTNKKQSTYSAVTLTATTCSGCMNHSGIKTCQNLWSKYQKIYYYICIYYLYLNKLILSHRRWRQGGRGAYAPLKFGKNLGGEFLCKIRAFFGQKSCKIREFC